MNTWYHFDDRIAPPGFFPEISSHGGRYFKKTSCGHGGRWRSRGRKAGEMGYTGAALFRHGSFQFSGVRVCWCVLRFVLLCACPENSAVLSLTSVRYLVIFFRQSTLERPTIRSACTTEYQLLHLRSDSQIPYYRCGTRA